MTTNLKTQKVILEGCFSQTNPYFSGKKHPPSCKITLAQKSRKMSSGGTYTKWKWRWLLRFSLVQVQGKSLFLVKVKQYLPWIGKNFLKCWGRKIVVASNHVFSLHLYSDTLLCRKVKTNTEIMWNNISIQRIFAHISISNRKHLFRH